MRKRLARIRVKRCAAIELGLEPPPGAVVRGVVGPARAGWRHRMTLHLPDDAFPDLAVRRNIRGVNALEAEARGFRARVMTGHAVLLDDVVDVTCGAGGSLRGGNTRGLLTCRGR